MRTHQQSGFLRAGVVACSVVFCLVLTILFGEARSSSADEPDPVWSKHVVQSYERLQEQQEATLRAIEQARQDAIAASRAIDTARQEAEATAKRNAEAIDSRLNRIEQVVSTQRERELETMRSSHRLNLLILGVFAGVGFVGMLLFALFLLRVMQRRTEAVLAQSVGSPLGQGYAAGALGAGDTHLVTVNPAEQSSARFLSAVERLEKRIHELESTAQVSPATDDADTKEAELRVGASTQAGSELGTTAARVALLLGKGQALLNLQQADTALACFDEAIGLDQTNAEAFVRKGAALEKLGRLDDAIDAYDRAIAADNAMTMAYLSKGGVFNRLERYSEALQCYEQALRAQQKARVS
jgi:tetratricopeptide (TPR) repeat protein